MKISIPEVINQIMAQSGISAVLNDDKCAALLTPDHENLLRMMIRQEFCHMGLRLASLLNDIDLDGDDADILTLDFHLPSTDQDTAIRAQLHTILATATLGRALTYSGIKEGAEQTSLAAIGLDLLLLHLTETPRPNSLTPRRY